MAGVEGRVTLVTGAGRGIGRVTAKLLSSRGAKVMAVARSENELMSLMRSVARDAGAFGVTSNAVLPGWVKTPMADASAKSEAEQRGISVDRVWEERASLYPAGRVVTPEEVAELIAFLASEESSGINGEAITVALGGLM